MATAMGMDAVARDLPGLLDRLRPGEEVTVVGSDGTPVAVIVSLKPEADDTEPAQDFEAEWDALADEVGRLWKDDITAVEAVAEQRR